MKLLVRAIVNGCVFDGAEVLEGHAVLINNGLVETILPHADLPTNVEVDHDLQGGCLIPGFIDLQVNGGGGVLFNDTPTVDGIRVIGEAHRTFGTTGFLPTLISTDFKTMRAAIRAVDDAIEQGVPGVFGIHLEGPFLNAERKGAHNDKMFCSIDEQAIDILTSLDRGKTIITIAPELTTAAVIRRIVDAGIVVCAGHSAADYQQTCDALTAGVSGFTHLFNAMTPMRGREPGMVGAAITDDKSWFGIIADGIHVQPAAFHVAVAAKRLGGAILVTDAMPPVGSNDNSFEFGGERIQAVDGRCTNEAGSLAGSVLSMIDAVNNAATYANIDWFEAVRMATSYPAKAIGLDERYGRIKKGYRASLVAVDNHRNITKTWVDGDCV